MRYHVVAKRIYFHITKTTDCHLPGSRPTFRRSRCAATSLCEWAAGAPGTPCRTSWPAAKTDPTKGSCRSILAQGSKSILHNLSAMLQHFWKVLQYLCRLLQNLPKMQQNLSKMLQNLPEMLQNISKKLRRFNVNLDRRKDLWTTTILWTTPPRPLAHAKVTQERKMDQPTLERLAWVFRHVTYFLVQWGLVSFKVGRVL